MNDRYEIFKKIDPTRVVEYEGKVSNENRIFFKMECEHPIGGSHYGRVYPPLIKDFEDRGELTKGKKPMETSTGTAGGSFKVAANMLGYPECVIAIPDEVEEARIRMLRGDGVEVIRTPGDYVNGFREFLETYPKEHPEVVFLNHSMGEKGRENKITTMALEAIAHEILEDPDLPRVDYYLAAVGNGSSLLGPARVFKARSPATRIVAYESVQSGVAFEYHHRGLYRQIFGIENGDLPRHRIFGTSYRGISFPHIRLAYRNNLVDETWLVADDEMDEHYFQETKRHLPALPRWDEYDLPDFPFGRSTCAGLAVGLGIAKQKHVRKKNIFVCAYEFKEGRYGQ